MRSNKRKAKSKAAARVGGTMFEYIGTSKAWNPTLSRKFKCRGSGNIGGAASDVRSVEITPELKAKYESTQRETKR